MQLPVICNSILLTLETLLSLLKEIKTISKNLGKIRAREGERELSSGRWSSTQEEVTIDALLLTRELIAREGLCRQRGRSRWEDQLQEKVAVEGGVCHRRISTLSIHCHRASGALIPQEDHHRCELREIQIKLGPWELRRLVTMSIESFFLRFESFVVAQEDRGCR